MVRAYLILFFLFIFLCCQSHAQLGEIGINPLKAEIGARPLGMGAAFAGLADDVNALLYNPGGMAWAKGISLTFRDFENITAVQAYPTGYGSSLGLAVATSKIANIPIGTREAYSSSSLVLLSYGTKLVFLPDLYKEEVFQKVGLGLNIKGLLGQTLSRTGQLDRSASGWNMDVGVLWKAADWWSVGYSAQNILPGKALGGEIKWDVGTEEAVPFTQKLAAAARFIGDIGSPVFMEGRELLLGGELDFSSTAPMLLRVGGEWSIDRTYFIRLGLMQQSRSGSVASSWNFGLGWRGENWGIDLVSYRESIRDEVLTCLSALYFPKEWIVIKKLDIPKPAVILEEPFEHISLTDNIVTYDSKIEVLGKVKPGVEVYVNGLRAATAADNTFKVVVPLQPEKNLIMVEARYEGEKKTWKYKVLRKAKVRVVEKKEVKLKEKVEVLVTLGVIEVTPEADFKLEASVTRGELATWLVKATGLRLPKVDRDPFPDVKRDNPLAPYIRAAVDWDLLEPFPDGNFRPGAPVSKEEGEKLFKIFGVQR